MAQQAAQSLRKREVDGSNPSASSRQKGEYMLILGSIIILLLIVTILLCMLLSKSEESRKQDDLQQMKWLKEYQAKKGK